MVPRSCCPLHGKMTDIAARAKQVERNEKRRGIIMSQIPLSSAAWRKAVYRAKGLVNVTVLVQRSHADTRVDQVRAAEKKHCSPQSRLPSTVSINLLGVKPGRSSLPSAPGVC